MDNIQNKVLKIYEFFAEICQVPHPSSHCGPMRDFLKKTADKHNLEYREDTAGNVRLDKKGFIHSQAFAMQAHMDMVPQTLDPYFDFYSQGIEFEEVDGFLQSKNQRTTLGADNGIGIAAALTAMTDNDLKDIPLCAVFTVDEETGMNGAKEIDPEFLECQAFYNLDSGPMGDFTIGCAGGASLTSSIPMQKQKTPSDCTYGVRVRCTGLKGGHSGTEINLNRGNAILILLDFVSESCAKVSEIKGGTLSNAIPREAEFTGAVHDFERLKKFAAGFTEKCRKTFDTSDNFDITVEKLDFVPEYCIDNFGHIALFLKSASYGVIAFDEVLNCVATSNNLAKINGDINKIELLNSQRSIYNLDRINLTRNLAEHFAKIGGENIENEGYPAWENSVSEEFLQQVSELYRKLFNKECSFTTIHAGLECGLLQAKNNKMPILSFGPSIFDMHSPSEKVELASLKDFYIFLANLLRLTLKK